MQKLISVPQLKTTFPWWPFAEEGTYRLIRLGRLGAVKVGRNVFLTEDLLRAFIASHTVTMSG